MNDDATKEILDVLTAFAERADQQAVLVNQGLKKLNQDVAYLKATSVTKEYLDEKLSDMYGHSMSVDKKVDKHVDAVVEVLAENKTITPSQKKTLMAMEPFPKLSV